MTKSTIKEKRRQRRNKSKITSNVELYTSSEEVFEMDYSIVPEDAEEYDPFTVAGFDIPTFDATDIEEVNEATEE